MYVYDEMHTNHYTKKNIVKLASSFHVYEHTDLKGIEKKIITHI